MERDQDVEIIIRGLAKEALQKRREEADGTEREQWEEVERLRKEVEIILGQLPADDETTLRSYLEKSSCLRNYLINFRNKVSRVTARCGKIVGLW